MPTNLRALLVLVLCLGAEALALPARCRAALDFTETTLSCDVLSPCTDSSSCQAGEACDQNLATGLCVASSGEDLFCCAGCICPTLNGAPGTCKVFGANAGFCLYSAFDYCATAGALSFSQFEACYTAPGGNRTRRYAEGDCDLDGIANGADPLPCGDGVDAGQPDAGEPDAGEPDAGGGEDAGVADAGGTTEVDAGALDSGTSPADSGQPAPSDAGDSSDGGEMTTPRESGCGCGSSAGAPLLALALALLAGCSRRRKLPS